MSIASYRKIPAGVAPPAGHCCPMRLLCPQITGALLDAKKNAAAKCDCMIVFLVFASASSLLLHRGCCGCCWLWSRQQRDSTHGLASLSEVTIARKLNRCEAARNRSAKARSGQITTEYRADCRIAVVAWSDCRPNDANWSRECTHRSPIDEPLIRKWPIRRD